MGSSIAQAATELERVLQNLKASTGDLNIVLRFASAKCDDNVAGFNLGNDAPLPAEFAGHGGTVGLPAVLDRVCHFRRFGVGDSEEVVALFGSGRRIFHFAHYGHL